MMKMNYGLAGRFKMTAHRVDEDGNIKASRTVADWFPNLITDAGLDRIATGSYLDFCQVGTGNSTPVNAATGLDTRIAGTSTIQASASGVQPSAPYYGYRQVTFRFAAGTATGNLSEVGVGWASTGSLFSRALILDGSGSPTTITILSDEVLDVSYEFRIYPPTSDVTTTVTISGVDYSITARAAAVTSGTYWTPPSGGINGSSSLTAAYNGVIGTITGTPSGSGSSASTFAVDTYSAASHVRGLNVTWGLNNGNVAGGISAALIYSTMGTTQYSFSPAIAKDATKTLTLNTTISWSRKTLP